MIFNFIITFILLPFTLFLKISIMTTIIDIVVAFAILVAFAVGVICIITFGIICKACYEDLSNVEIRHTNSIEFSSTDNIVSNIEISPKNSELNSDNTAINIV